MKPIIAMDREAITVELEAWVRATAMEERFAAALVLVLRKEGGAYFSVAADSPDLQLQLGAMLMHLGKQMALDAQRAGGKIQKGAPRLVGES